MTKQRYDWDKLRKELQDRLGKGEPLRKHGKNE